MTPSGTFAVDPNRSASLLGGIALALLVETIGLHLWLSPRHPIVAWLLSLTSLATLAWLVADYRALAAARVTLDGEALRVAIGRRVTGIIPRSHITTVMRPSWRDLPEPGSAAASGYLNPCKPGTPNVLLGLEPAAELTVMGIARRRVSRLGLCMERPDEFLAMAQPQARQAVT